VVDFHQIPLLQPQEDNIKVKVVVAVLEVILALVVQVGISLAKRDAFIT
jgi:hypothetical protein